MDASAVKVHATDQRTENTNCYRIKAANDTAASSTLARAQVQTWCYHDLQTPGGSLYIFNADRARVRPELALVRHIDGTMTYGSLSQGDVSFHKSPTLFLNPIPAPLKKPTSAPHAFDDEISANDGEIAVSAAEVLKQLLSERSEVHESTYLRSRAIRCARADSRGEVRRSADEPRESVLRPPEHRASF